MLPRSRNIAMASIGWLLWAVPTLGQDIDGQSIDGDSLAAARAEFVTAFETERRGLPTENDSARLRAYPLYRYLEAARLERGLADRAADASELDSRVADFLSEFGDEPVGVALRRAWLESLAARERWEALIEHFDSGAATQALECQRLIGHIALGRTVGIAPQIAETWLTPRQLPAVCEEPFRWLRNEGLLDASLTEQRARLLLANGQAAFAAIIARRLPGDAAAAMLAWADLIQSPATSIDALMRGPNRPFESTALLDGFARLTRNDPEAALERIDALIALLGDEPAHAREANLALALGLSWDRDVRALDFFARVSPALDDYALQWLARTALWAGQWALVESTVAAMSDKQRAESVWRYWAARAAEALDDPARARDLYESVLPDDNYYSVMAAARLGIRFEPHAEAIARNDEVVADLAAWPELVRARELTLSGLRSRATLEWRHADGFLSDDERVQSIHLASRWRLYDIAVATATRLEIFHDYAVLYPRPYREPVRETAELTGIESDLILAMLRQESLFRPDAVSAADAVGLAQLQPSTAVLAARSRNLPQPSRSDLFDPATNIELGAVRLESLLDEFGGQLPVALAAYNAGNGPAWRWLPEEPIAADVWIENIPFNETRAYVRRVLWHSLVYEWLERRRPVATDSWIDLVGPIE